MGKTISRHIGDQPDRNSPVKTLEQKMLTRVANRPSERQRKLTSKKAETLFDRPDRLYRGEDLKRGYR
jgi:hypothetical protein